MFTTGSQVYLWILDESNERVLHQGVVVGVKGQAFVAEFEEQIKPEIGGHVKVYREVDRKFMQQPGKVQVVLKTEPRPVIGFVKVGEPSNAENRGAYRVSVAAADLTVKVNGETMCKLLDVSATGFSFASPTPLEKGGEVSVETSFQGKTYTGKAYIHTVRELDNGQHRCGVQAEEGGNLLAGLETISTTVQREQLRRLSGQAG